MKIGIPKEIKVDEYRVGLIPRNVRKLVERGHEVFVESGAGIGIGISDAEYQRVGAKIAPTAEAVFAEAELVIKVKEPQPEECQRLRSEQTIFTFLHLAPDPVQANLLQESGCTAIAYETVTSAAGGLPILAPMSAVAGRMAVQAGAHCLEKSQGGRGVLLGGVAGVPPANVVVIGGGVVGANAVEIALGMQAEVTVIDKSERRLAELKMLCGGSLKVFESTPETITEAVVKADLVVGAVLLPGAAAPKLINYDLLRKMQCRAVIVDVAIDQGGCFETSHPTTHQNPTFIEEGIIHYCVSNMPGAVPRTSTFALNHVTFPFVEALANKGIKQALLDDPHLFNGLNVMNGQIVNRPVAEALEKEFVDPRTLIGG